MNNYTKPKNENEENPRNKELQDEIDQLQSVLAIQSKEIDALNVMGVEVEALRVYNKQAENGYKKNEKQLKLDLIRKTWTERRLNKQLDTLMHEQKVAEEKVEMLEKRNATTTSALLTHFESRSLLILMVRKSLENFVKEMASKNQAIEYDGGMFVGARDPLTG